MPDVHLRNASAPPGADREEKIERLLLTGLDHYLVGRYDQAIDVWTRVLFLDRHHARARAYIERARSAQAERQRESDALLDDGLAALRRGETATARRLITSAVDRGGSTDEALVFLERLDRLDAASGRSASPRRGFRRRRRPSPVVAAKDPGARRWLLLTLVGVLMGAIVAVATNWDRLEPILLPPAAPSAVAPTPVEPLPVPSPASAALARAHSLFQRGHLREALHQIEEVSPGDPLAPEAAALRITIQRTLLRGADPGRALDAPSPVAEGHRAVP